METTFVREAILPDAARIASIYNEGIEDRVATFETELRTAKQIEAWFGSGNLIVVAGLGGVVGAYAATFPYRSRSCYDGVREFSVYVARNLRGHGLGKLAMQALIKSSRERGWWKLLSRIFPENAASLALCHALGFRNVGIYRRHAKLDGIWRDVVIVEKLLDADD
jgi:phosphinothricin acetyltransferase